MADEDALRDGAARLGLRLTEDEIAPYADALTRQLAGYQDFADLALADLALADLALDGLGAADAGGGVRAGHRPPESEDPENIWLWRGDIAPTGSGCLDGLTVALKDHIPVRGVPLTFGTRAMDGFVADVDVPVVTRLLAAGAHVVGKLNMDDFSCGGLGWGGIGDFGRIPNPYDASRLTGGSSSGSAAAVALCQCDLTLGGDQGGSVRIPAAWCGVVGLKPTHGLVPHTGIVGSDPILDAVGPLALTVETVARALEALAGHDGLDPRWHDDPGASVPPDGYLPALARGVDGLRIGVLAEGFDEPIDAGVAQSVRAALDLLVQQGATLVPVSVPVHRGTLAPYQILSAVGSRLLRDSRFLGLGAAGWFPRQLIDGLDAAVRDRADELPPLLKLRFLAAEAMYDRFGSGLYAKARSAREWFAAQYDAVLSGVDALAMPTVVMTAPAYELPADHADGIRRTLGMFHLGGRNPVSNTAPFNYTGHPAVTVPCGLVDGLPAGLQFVARRWDDATALTLAHAYQSAAPPPVLPARR